MTGITTTIWPIDPHTHAKHEILRNYLEAWFPILSSWAGRIIYLDGFAGPGVYSGGEDGSPVIALTTAINHRLRDKFKEIVFLFIEKDHERATKLKAVLKEKFPNLPKNIKYEVIGAEFAPTLANALDSIEKQGGNLAPTFAFLDPFGFSGLPMGLIARMMKNKTCEVLVTFMINFVNRFSDELREEALDELFGTQEWRHVRSVTGPDKRRKFLLNLYESELKKVANPECIRSFEMVGSYNQPIYYLVYGTKHWRGLEVMKEAMWEVDRRGTFRFSDITDPNQKFLIDYSSEESWIPVLANMLWLEFAGKTAGIEAIHEFAICKTPYKFRKIVLQYLEQSVPPKITRVWPRRRVFTYPDGCRVTFLSR